VAATGFTGQEIQEMMNLGLNQDDIADMEAAFLDGVYDLDKAGLLARLGDIQATNLDLIDSLNDLSADMAPIIATLENDPLVGDQAPVVNAGSGYSGTVGTAVQFDGSASSNVVPGAVYEWDLDGDGEFDDASGATPTYTYTEAYNGLVGLKVSNDPGAAANIDYAPVAIAPVNGRPAISDSSPTERVIDLTLGDSQSFSVTAVDPDGDPLSFNWQVDGGEVGSGSSYTFTPDLADVGYRWVIARIGENTAQPGARAGR
jgi:PKD repeat protein